MISSIVASTIIYPELILRSSVSLATNLVTSVNYLISISRSDIELQNLLISNDIIEDINIIKNFIEEKANKKHCQTTQVCIENLNKTLIELEKNIKNMIVDKSLFLFRTKYEKNILTHIGIYLKNKCR